MSKIFKRTLSALLVAVMLLSAVPFGAFSDLGLDVGIEASAASSTVAEKMDKFFQTVKGVNKGNYDFYRNGVWIAGQCNGFANDLWYHVFGYDMYLTKYRTVTKSCTNFSPDSLRAYFISNARIGDIFRSEGSYKHSFVIRNANNNFVIVYEYGGNKKYSSGAHESKYTWTELSKMFRKASYANFYQINNDIYGGNEKLFNFAVSLLSSTNVSNEAITLNAKLNYQTLVQKFAYVISESESEIKNTDFTNINNHGLRKTRAFLTDKDYSSSPKSYVNYTTIVNKLRYADSNGKEIYTSIKPNKKYYYKILVKTGNLWFQSDTGNFTTSNIKPSSTTVKVNSDSENIGISDTATISWNAATGATSYIAKLYDSNNNLVYTSKEVQGTLLSFPKECFKKADTYYVALTAKNAAGTTDASNKPQINVHNNVNVTFYDTVSKCNIATCSVAYGHNANLPADPVQNGYTFKKWDGKYEKVTENTTINTVYEANQYTVNFVDGLTGEILKTEKVKYNSAASAPTAKAHDGYEFKDWDKSYSKITDNTTVTAIYKWYNDNYPVVSTINTFSRTESGNGYDYEISIKSNPNFTTDKVIKGRLIIALKTADGYMFVKTDSAAFSLKPNGTAVVSGFIDSDNTATTVEIYTVQNYDCAGVLATPVIQTVDNSGCWSGWVEYSGSVPVTKGVNGVTSVETKTVKYYREKNKETTTSYATSLSGYTQNGYTLVKSSTGTVSYVSSWPSTFSTSNSLYKQYNVTPKTASETSTQKTVIDSTTTQGYIYWHWCRGSTSGATNRVIDTECEKLSTGNWNTFHAFYSTSKYSNNSSVTDCVKQTNSACSDSYWWWGFNSQAYKSAVTVKKQTYTIYNKLYNYYRWTDWSEWSEKVSTASNTKQVETKSVTYYRYKSDQATPEPQASTNQLINNLTLKTLDTSKYANKEATIFVYKYTDPSDFTNEYIGKTTIGSDGNISLGEITLREAPTVESGDYIIAAAVEGYSGTIEIGKIEAPKKQCTIKFYDFDKTTVIYETTVDQGSTVVTPDISSLTVPEGNVFVRWNQSTVNVQDDLDVFPEAEAKECVVVFIDWGKQEYELRTLHYGDEVIIPPAEGAEGIVVSWDLSGLKEDNGEYYVVGNTVITTVYEEKINEIKFINPDSENFDDIIETSTSALDTDCADIVAVPYGADIPTPSEIDESPEYLFYGWKSLRTGEYLTDMNSVTDDTYYPVYEYADYSETPTASVTSGEYTENQTVSLTCATENSVIYYTLDGSNPETSDTAIEYTEPITISKSCTLSFVSMTFHKNNSGVIVENYAINKSTTAVKYHIVNIYCNIETTDGTYCQLLAKEGTSIDFSQFKNITGYNFDGIYYDEEYVDQFDEEYDTVEESMNLYIKYIPKTYTVTFKDYDGTVISTSEVEYGTGAIPPESPVREGYVFIGWDSEDYACVTADGVFTAKYVLESEYATVSLTRKSFSGIVGGHRKLNAVVTPSNLSGISLSWVTSDPTVAEVDYNGDVTFVGAGTATITVIVDSTGASDTCTIRVNADPNLKITLGSNSSLGLDSEGNIRDIKNGENTVAEIKEQFVNDDLVFIDAAGNQLSDKDLVGTGTVIKLYDNNELLDSKTVVMTGDVNCDGVINNKDAAMTSRYLVDKEEADYYQMIALDVNGDGYVNNRDASMISRYLVGKEVIK